MNKEILDEIMHELCAIRDGLLGDSRRDSAAFHLGILTQFIKTELDKIEREDEII